MNRLWMVVLVSLFSLASAAEAWGCSMLVPSYQDELRFQQRRWANADAIFLARATPREGFESDLRLIATITGSASPKRSMVHVNGMCGEAPPEGVVIVFAQRLDPGDFPWRPWRWREWVVTSYVYPHEVVDPQMVTALRETTERLRSNR